ncbi:MAG TPA: ATP-binding cassette domain-containing protein [Anaerolineae bacterium]
MPISIHVAELTKYYRVHHKQPGLRGSLASFLRREYQDVRAVDGITFDIEQGEIVGFLGPNGAGKTTTLKCLAGLLYPTGGEAAVLGYLPQQRQNAFLGQITLVMGQRNQLTWDLPAMETFLVNQAIYGIAERQFRATLDELVALLDLGPLLTKQVRKLSLGERMKCELAAALLHRPRVLFLDEPTLGLDVNAQVAIREFIQAYCRQNDVTVLLTSHYMADVTALARRVLVIEQGKLVYDGDLRALVEQMAPYKLLKLTFERTADRADLVALGEIETLDTLKATLRVPNVRIKEVANLALANLPVADVVIEEPPIEEIIRRVFSGRAA